MADKQEKEKMEIKQYEYPEVPHKAIAHNTMFFDPERFAFAKEVAKMFATSSMLPDVFRGGEGVGNCMIALNLAERMQVDPFMLMQNMYIVHGRPGIEAKLAIALINGCGRFEPIKYEYEGEGKARRCRAYAREKRSNEVLQGPWVTWEMVEAEGWHKPKGQMTSKWMTMPEIMFRYRSAMFFARVYVPDVLVGLKSVDEFEDDTIDTTWTPVLNDNKEKIQAEANKKPLDVTPEIVETKKTKPEEKAPAQEEQKGLQPEPDKLACPSEYFNDGRKIYVEVCQNCRHANDCAVFIEYILAKEKEPKQEIIEKQADMFKKEKKKPGFAS